MFQMLSRGKTRYIGVKIVGEILNATTMCPVRTLKLNFRAHFECFQHVIPRHIVNTWCLESQCSLHVLTRYWGPYPQCSWVEDNGRADYYSSNERVRLVVSRSRRE